MKAAITQTAETQRTQRRRRAEKKVTTRAQILVRGIVQGVGFRPFVFSHASRRSLSGCVLNNSAGVLIDLEGDASEIDNFVHDLESNPPHYPRSSRSSASTIWV